MRAGAAPLMLPFHAAIPEMMPAISHYWLADAARIFSAAIDDSWLFS
jgi:hypothetical protein